MNYKPTTKILWSGCVQQIPRSRMIEIMLENLKERKEDEMYQMS